MKHSKKMFYIFVVMLSLVVLVACGCNRPTVSSYSDFEKTFKTYAPIESTETDKTTRTNQLISALVVKTTGSINKVRAEFGLTELTNSELSDKQNELTPLLQTKTVENCAIEASAWLKNQYTSEYEAATSEVKAAVDTYLNEIKEYNLISRLKEVALASVSVENWSGKNIKNYQIERLTKANEEAIVRYEALDTTLVIGEGENAYDDAVVNKAKEYYDAANLYANDLSHALNDPRPMQWELNSFGDFFTNFFNNFLILPIGYAIYGITLLFGGNYAIGLIIVTLLIRTIGWPIYTRSNDMTLKMKMMEPEQAKIQEKYARRQDKESQQMMQMEMAQLYKKYGIGFGGCIMPFLQLPIFIGIFRAVQSFPYTPTWAANVKNTLFFGIDLFKDKGTMWSGQWWGVIILCVLVAGTQILQQILTNRRQKKAQDAAQSDIPAYRRQAVSQSQTNKSMQIFMWVMVGMMVVFVYTSQAGLGLYWLIGNTFALFQTYIGSKNSEKRLAQLREKARGNR